MNRILTNKRLAFGLYLLLMVISVGLGMGVPLPTILLGGVVGWFLPAYLALPAQPGRKGLRSLLKIAALTSALSAAGLSLIWLPALSWLADPARDLAEFGMPLILFEPLASFIGWIVLMVLISPFLQFLMTVLGGILRLAFSWPGENERSG
jgi:hypothetical protein